MSWYLLVTSLPTVRAADRMRVWRGLKALGCGVLRDGVYLLPARPAAQEAFAAQLGAVQAAGGQAYLMALPDGDADQEQAFRALFDRGPGYADLQQSAEDLRGRLNRMQAGPLAREWDQLKKAHAALQAIDYFPGAASEQVAALLDDLGGLVAARLSPDEPHAVPGMVPRLDPSAYQGRTWATRKRLWVDRMASAWLIRRFIDAKARFRWLSRPEDCPKTALGFDFDGAAFTHIGSRVTFEVLLASFGLDDDAALKRMAGIVHFLDVGGVPVAEAAGLEAVLKGLRESARDDDALLAAAAGVLDGLYAAFEKRD